jgi:hypothetical protein
MHSHSLRVFILGAAAFTVSESLWLLIRPIVNEYPMWVLEPNAGILLCALIITFTSMWLGFSTRLEGVKKYIELLKMYAGVCFSIPFTMFVVANLGQDSNLWPIVLVIDFIIMVPLVAVGWFFGIILRWFNHAD